ncbi:uncharacterized protein [Apostichopus japonicus]|uniref:uncharacterized protein isoform X1 n=1 Tax=Stichopus japonicus TaxID=307972 RepID=UPI003AB7F009
MEIRTIFGIPGIFLVLLTLLLMPWRTSSSDICKSAEDMDATIEDPCSKGGLQMTNGTNLPCTYEKCMGLFKPPACNDVSDLSLPKHYNTLITFTATQCMTEGSPVHLGLNFSWTINNTADEVTGLKVVISYVDYPAPFDYILEVDLTTQHIVRNKIETSSTICVPFDGIQNGKSFSISAQVLPKSSNSYLKLPPLKVEVVCNQILVQHTSFCLAVPKTRPVAKAYCNKTVSVTFTPEAPPGIGDRTEYNVSIGLFKGETPAYLQTLTLPATAGNPYSPSTYFANVSAGTYNAKFAFLDDDGLPCGDIYYNSSEKIIIQDPLTVLLQLEGFCDRTISVNLTTDEVQYQQSVYDTGQVCLYEGSNITDCDIPIASTFSKEGFYIKNFTQRKPGNYHAKFVYLDSQQLQCNDDAVYQSDEYAWKDTDCPKNQSKMIFGASIGVVALLVVLAVGSAVLCLVHMNNQHQQQQSQLIASKEEESLSGMVIIPKDSSTDRRSNGHYCNGMTKPFTGAHQTQKEDSNDYPDSGLPLSIPIEFNDGKSRIIDV